MSNKDAIAKHLENGRQWDQETYLAIHRSRAIAWIIAGGSFLVALSLGIAISFLLPLKEPVPYVITVDKQSGYLEIAKPLNDKPLAKQQAITDYNLVQYVQLRESYLNAIAPENYHKVQAMSKDIAAKEHKLLWDGGNPNNPSVIFGYDGQVDVSIISVTPLNDKTASVRFARRVTHNGKISERRYAAILIYEYSNHPMTNQERLLNPLGFKVTSYRVTEEFTNQEK